MKLCSLSPLVIVSLCFRISTTVAFFQPASISRKRYNNNNSNSNNNIIINVAKPSSSSCHRSIKNIDSNVVLFSSSGSQNQNNYQDGEVGKGPNWIEKAFPVDTNEKIDTKKIDDYNLGISGKAFQTGQLSKRMFDAIISKTSLAMSDEVREAFTVYAMDFTAKEATRAALTQNGLEMVLMEEEEDQGMWGDIEAVRLYDIATGIPFNRLYDSLEDAVKEWTPGQQFDFVVRQVPAKMKELSVDELLQALDPEGSLREEATRNDNNDDDDDNNSINDDHQQTRTKGGLLHDEENVEEALLSIYDSSEISSLSDLANDCTYRTENSPREATTETNAYAGWNTRGYNAINRSDLAKDPNGGENHNTLMHVMDALVSHGVVLVDLTDGGTNFEIAKQFAQLWKAAEGFFDSAEQDSVANSLPGMTTVMETGSKHAKVGYATADGGSLRFLETRVDKTNRNLLPKEARDILGDLGTATMQECFDVVTDVSKSVIRIATAASSVEHGAFIENENDDETVKLVRASNAASLLVNELVDDGKSLGPTVQIDHDEGTVSMTPHRLCRYAWEGDSSQQQQQGGNAREIFGAHTDSSFITAIPVASVCGLEVLDEATEQWYRPELRARALWEAEMQSQGKDPSAIVEELEDGTVIPWHCRYVALMAGEHLQLVSRNEIPAAVHRVVATKEGAPRFSSPILIRGRPGVRFLANRYLGGTLGSPLLQECNKKTMEEIYEATQPSSFQ